MGAFGRVWIDNEEGRFVRVQPGPERWIDLPYHPVIQTFELADCCVLVYDEDAEDAPALAAYTFDGTCLWSRRAHDLPMHDVRPGRWHCSTVTAKGERPERRLNRGDRYCVVNDWRTADFGPVQSRSQRP